VRADHIRRMDGGGGNMTSGIGMMAARALGVEGPGSQLEASDEEIGQHRWLTAVAELDALLLARDQMLEQPLIVKLPEWTR